MLKSIIHVFIFLFSVTISSSNIYAQCTDPDISDGIIEYQNEEYDVLKSVGRWANSCTAVFIKTSENLEAPAYAITNGHCIDGFTNYKYRNEVAYNVESDESISFNYFANTEEDFIKVAVERVEMATMKGVDLAIVKLSKTIGEMIDLGLEPITVSQEEPELGDDVKIVGVPLNLPGGDRLRLTSGSLTGKSPVVLESGWLWRNMFENKSLNIVPGSSGSPVFRCFNDGLYGLINTTNADFEFPCELASPCEVEDLTQEFDPKTNYVVDVRPVIHCFNDQGIFDTSLPGFPYDLSDNVIADYEEHMLVFGGLSLANQINPEIESSLKNLKIQISNKQYYRYKFASYNESFPWSTDDLSEVLDVTSNEYIEDPLPMEEGVYFVTVIGGDTPTYDDTWQDIEDATVIPIIIDKTPPTQIPGIMDTGSFPGYYEIVIEFENALHLSPNRAHGLPNFDENDYSLYKNFGLGFPLVLEIDKGPYKVCAYFNDSAGNPGPIFCKIFSVNKTDQEKIDDKITVFPNPVSESINFEFDENIQLNKVELYNLLGNRIFSEPVNNQTTFPLSDYQLTSGMYVIKLVTDRGVVSKQIVFESR